MAIASQDISSTSNLLFARVLVPAALSLAVAGCSSNPWKKADYKAGTLGASLNSRFEDHVKNCNIFEEAASELAIDRDYVPSDFWSGIGGGARKEKTQLMSTASSRLLFLFPFSKDETTGATALAPEFISMHATRALKEGSLSPIGDVNGNQVLPLRAAGATLYRQSCSSYLNSATNAGIDLGAARMKSGLKAEFNSHSNVLLMYGTFESPLYRALTSPGSARRYARLLFWTNYYRDAALAAKKPVYLKSFRGAVYARTAVGSRSTTFTASAAASGSVGFFSGDIDVKAGFGEGSDVDSASFSLFLLGTSPDAAQFQAGPTIDEISGEIQAAFDVASSVIPALAPNDDHVQEYDMSGIPGALCSDGMWTISATGTTVPSVYSEAPTLRVNASGVDQNGIPRCTFVIRGKPVQQVFQSVAGSTPGNTSVNVAYTISSVEVVGSSHLSAAVSRSVNVLPGPYPDTPVDSVRVKLENVNGRIRPSWAFRVPLVDSSALLADFGTKPPRLVDASQKIACGSGDDAEVRAKVTPASGVNAVDVDVTSDVDYSPAQQLAALASRSCTFSLRIRVGLIQQRGTPAAGGKPAVPDTVTDYLIPISAKLNNPFTRTAQP